MNRTDREGLILFTWPILERQGVRACTASGINAALHAPGTSTEDEILAGRRLLSEALEVSSEEWICADQVHSASSALLTSRDSGRGAKSASDAIEAVDALILTERGTQGMIFTADCLPLVLYDRKQWVGSLVHAGWRGAAAGIVPSVLERMVRELGCDAKDIIAAAGPAVDSCCYQVDLPVYRGINEPFPECRAAFTEDGEGHWRLSLEKAVFLQLQMRGVLKENCEGSGLCSACNDELFSYRRDKEKAGRMATCLILH